MESQNPSPSEVHAVQTNNGRFFSCRLPPWRAVVTIIACLIVEATLGVTYTYGNMLPYVTSYLRNVTQDTSLDYGHMLWLSTSRQLVHSAAVSVLGLLAARIPVKLYLFIGITINAASFFGTYGAVKTSFAMMIVVHSIVQAISQAMLFPICVSIALQWFPERKGLAGGITMSGFGGGAFIWNLIVTHWINPDNLQPDYAVGDHLYFTQNEVLKNVPTVYLLLGGLLTTIQVMCGLAMFIPPSTSTSESDHNKELEVLCDNHQKVDHVNKHNSTTLGNEELPKGGGSTSPAQAPTAEAEEDGQLLHADRDLRKRTGNTEEGSKMIEATAATKASAGARRTDGSECPEFTPLQIVTSRATWILWLNSVASDYGAIFVFDFYKTYGQTFIRNDHFLSVVGSFGSVFNASLRPLWGILADYVGFLPALIISQAMQVLLLATFFLCELSASPAMYFIWVCGLYGSICGIYALQGPIVSNLFGHRYMVFSLGIVYSSTGLVSCLTAVPITKAIMASFSWKEIFFVAAALVAFAIILFTAFLINCGRPLPSHMQEGLLRRRFRFRRRKLSDDSPDVVSATKAESTSSPLAGITSIIS